MIRFASVLVATLSTFTATPSSAQQWVPCSAQGELCDLDGVGIVRYGVDERWLYQVGTDWIACTDPAPFGDPAPGAAKSCQRWELPDELARSQESVSLRTQLQQAQQQIEAYAGQEEYTAQLEQELAATRQELRQLRRGVRRNQRESFGPVFQFGR